MPQQGDSLETLYVDIAARADQLVQDADAAVKEVVRKLDQLEEKTKETERAFGGLGDFIKQSLSMAAGMGLAQVGGILINAITGFGKAMIESNAQMQTFQRSFEVLTGSAEEAGEIIEWVKEQAKATPFDVPGLIQASQMLMTWGLSIQEWFTVVGDTAAAMNRPITQVVNAVGTLATGQTGEAVRRFRDLGINLREYAQFEFDAQGALVTPLSEAIPMVRQIMIDRFGGMMESQSKTWSGVMSNMADTWQQFVQVVGQPLFESLNETLNELWEWVEANADSIENFGRTLGSVFGYVLDVLMRDLETLGKVINLVDDLATKIAGPEWLERGITAGRQLAGLFGGAARGTIDLAGGLLAGEGLEEAGLSALEVWRETALAIGGAGEEAERVLEAMTKAEEAGARAAKALKDEYGELSDVSVTVMSEAALVADNWLSKMVDAGYVSQEAADAHREQASEVLDLANAYREGAEAYVESRERMDEMRAAMEAVRIEQEKNLELATEVADKLGDRLQSAMEKYEETMAEAADQTAETIAEIESKAAAAEAQAVAKNQQAIAKLRADFAREQMRRRRQFNVEWARLIREQNQEVIDAEWEYEYAKENLLIEGDEIALADLEARYEHEKSVREREQGDARSDMQTRFDLESQERQEQFEQQVRQLEDRLGEEIENIRRAAREEVREKEEALEEKRAKEEEAMRERLMKIGEMQQQEVGDNQVVTDMLVEMWRQLYGDQAAEAIRAGIIQRQELEAIRAAALRAAEALRNVRLGGAVGTGGRRGPVKLPGGGYARQYGGYSPPGETTVTTHPGEFMSDVATTRALEQATGGPLTQQTVRSLAESRKVVDFNLHGYGLPADIIDGMRRQMRDLIDAFSEDIDTF